MKTIVSLFYPASGSMQFPYNPLTMRMLSSTPPTSMACPSPSMQSQQQQQQGGASGPVASTRAWEREPPLLSEQYETLSDSDDWGRSSPPSSTQASTPHSCSPSPFFRCLYESHSLPFESKILLGRRTYVWCYLWCYFGAHWWSERALQRATDFQD